ncbi:MAG: HAMP domain-containing histidine kinase, partial [Gammaproteobacteria bacterium]|nr:HAMP domain-containing histidine kinase [Gammaproteobacteria bacterium]
PLWADALFDLKEVSLMETWESAQAALNHASQTLKVSYSTTRYLPLPTSDDVDVLNQEKTALKQLRKNAEADNLFALAKEGLSNAGSQDELGQAMSSAARLLFGHGESLLFIYSEDADSLSCLTGTPSRNELNQIVIRCEPDRSVIADCFLGNSAILQSPSEQQTVIDKQILSLLGTDNFCCESLVNPHTDGPCGVLVLGIPLQQIDNYKKQISLRYEFCLELGKKLAGKQEFMTVEGDVIAGYERRIRETIHEANNPLGIIKNYLQLLSIKQGEDTKIQSEISFMKSEIDRVSGILEKLKEKPEEIEQSVAVDINSVVTSLVNMFSGSFAASESINIETSLDSDLPELACSENTIRQIITNLVKNSAEAFEDGGTLLVKTAGNFYMNGNRYIQLIVKDNGPGIAASILDKLFASGNNVKSGAGISSSKINSSNISTSNISTKGGSHMGSGLSIVQNLVAELGGQISCQTRSVSSRAESGNKSHKNSGTEITVLLPVSVSKQNTSLNTLTKNNNSADLS